MPNYGRHYSLSRPDWGWIGPNQMRGVTFNRATQHLWVYRFGIWGGKNTNESNSNVNARIALYDSASLNPNTRLGYSSQFNVSTPMIDSVSGAEHTANVAVIDVDSPNGVNFKAIPIHSGFNYHLAVLGTSGYLSFGMIAAARFEADNKRFYDRTGIGQPPPQPFGAYSSSYEGHIAIWAAADTNQRPSVPNFREPLGSIVTTTPVFRARFNDANTNRGDYLNQYRIQVRRKSDGASMWNATYTASQAERTPEADGHMYMGRAYGGNTLSRGETYEWRVQMSDHFGAWSDWSTWLEFTPTALGTITLDGQPNGKIETNEPTFNGKWTHQTGTSMKRVQVRIWNSSGNTLLQTGADYNIADVASSPAPGTAFTIPWASAGLSSLAWGTDYQYSMRGHDGTQWSDWSAKRSFKTNAAPTVPSGLAPMNGVAVSTYPLLTAQFSDADDTPATGLTGFARIKDEAGTVLATREMVYSASAGWWEYQTDGGDLPSYATYRWDAYGYDGTLYSGEQSSVATAAKSAEAVFVFAEGPTVTITSPAETAPTPSLLLSPGESRNRDGAVSPVIHDDVTVVPGEHGDAWRFPAGMSTSNPGLRIPLSQVSGLDSERGSIVVRYHTDSPSFEYLYSVGSSASGFSMHQAYVGASSIVGFYRNESDAVANIVILGSPADSHYYAETWDGPDIHASAAIGSDSRSDRGDYPYQPSADFDVASYTASGIDIEGVLVFDEALSPNQVATIVSGGAWEWQGVSAPVVTTSSFTVSWETMNQARYRVYLYTGGGTQILYDSGEIIGDASSHVIPSGFVQNNTSYQIVVWVADTNDLVGQSLLPDVTVRYPATSVVSNFTADPVNIGSDIWNSAVRLNWEQTLYATDVWQDYTIVRTAGSGVDAERIILARITSPTQLTFTDYTPASGIEYTYEITQTIMTGVDMLPSDPVTASASVSLGGVVLVSVTEPERLRTNLRYTRERDFGRTTRESVYEPVSGAKPTTVRTKTYYRDVSFDAQIFDDAAASALVRRLELEAIDEDGGTYCYRDNHGRKMFITIPNVTITDQVPDWYTASIDLREERFREGTDV